MENGQKYTYKELGSYLATKKSDSAFFVVIRPGEKCTYKSTVDILDLMTVQEVKNYKMEDPTKRSRRLLMNS